MRTLSNINRCPSYRVYVEHVDGEVVGGEVHRAEELLQRHHLPVARLAHLHSTVDNVFPYGSQFNCTYLSCALRLEVLLDEPEEMLLVHTGGRVDVRVHLAHVVKVAVRHRLLRSQLPVKGWTKFFKAIEHDNGGRSKVDFLKNHSYRTSEVRGGKGFGIPKVENSTDKVCHWESDKGEGRESNNLICGYYM